MKISSVKYLVGQGIRNIWTNRVMSFASFCILLVSILAIGFTILSTSNINKIIGGIENKNEVIIYLSDMSSDEQITALGDKLKKADNIKDVLFYSKEEAFEAMKRDYENADELFSYFTESPLPDAYKIKVEDISTMLATEKNIKNIDSSGDNIIYEIKAPNDFANILTELKTTITFISTAVLIALIVVCMVIISNTTRSSVFARRKEINIMKYVGATNTFIKVPFFVEGMVTGVIAGAVASVLTWFVYDSLIGVLSKEMTLWNALGIKEFIQFNTIAVKLVACYILSGAFLGAIGSVLSTRKHLQV